MAAFDLDRLALPIGERREEAVAVVIAVVERADILLRTDSAGATHELIDWARWADSLLGRA